MHTISFPCMMIVEILQLSSPMMACSDIVGFLMAWRSLRFLGHTINAKDILSDQEHLDAVRNALPPSDAASLQSFPGLVSWYSKFLPGFATVVAPMRECAKEKGLFAWTPAAQNSFEDIKRMLVSSPALAIYDPTLHSVISTDASDYGLGAVFAQYNQMELTDAEKKYSIVEKEALACVWATEKWRTYLWGHRFILRTDHQALTTLLTTKGMGRAGMRIARWAARLLCFDYNVNYNSRPGSLNPTADCLSRLPIPAPADSSADVEPEIVAFISSTLCSLSVTDFETACAVCPELEKLRQQITCGWPPSIKAVSQDLIPYFRVRDELSVKDALIFRGTRLLPCSPPTHCDFLGTWGSSAYKTEITWTLLVAAVWLPGPVNSLYMHSLPV